MYIVKNELPYFLDNDKKTIYPCELTATKITVNFEKPIPLNELIDCILTDNEIKSRYNIALVDGWDKVSEKVIKVSNKKVSSIGRISETNLL